MTREAGYITTSEMRDSMRQIKNESELLEVIQTLMHNFPKGSFAYKALDDFALDLEGYILYGDEDGRSN